MSQTPLPSYLTTREVADLLRIKERRIYDLVASGGIPHSRATGKLLFPRAAVLQWITGDQPVATDGRDRPAVVLGSHDPLLDWALRESGSGLAAFFDGSLDGLHRFAAGEGLAAGLHLPDRDGADWNVQAVADRFGSTAVVLAEWAWRQRGLVVADGNPMNIDGLADLPGKRVVSRQAAAGSHRLLDDLLEREKIKVASIRFVEPAAREETEAALAVLEGRADVAFGLECLAAKMQLHFIPVINERFDLLVDRRAWFETPFQAFLAFCRSETFIRRAADMRGYDISGHGTIHFNGA